MIGRQAVRLASPVAHQIPQISMVVIAFNNSETIGECVRSLEKQTIAEKEVIVVVDTNSRDNTKEVVEELSHQLGFRVELCSSVGRSEARNIGWRASQSDVLMFADGDDVYTPEYASKALECLDSKSGIGGVCVGGAPLKQGTGLIERYQASFGSTDSRQIPKGGPNWAFVYRRECLTVVRGFDERLSQAEDRDLCSRVKQAGFEIGYVAGVNWYHRKPRTLGEFLNKEFRAGVLRVPYELKHAQYSTIAFSLIPFLWVAALAIVALLSPISSAVILLIGLLAYFGLTIARRGRFGAIPDMIPFAAISLGGKLAECLGSIVGLIRYSREQYGSSAGEDLA